MLLHYFGGYLTALHSIAFVGVDVFFVISGYIITKTYLESDTKPIRFLMRRFARIYSCYWIALIALIAAHLVFGQSLSGYKLTQTIFLVPVLRQYNPFVVVWSLYHELVFYILFCLAVSIPLKIRSGVIAIFCLTIMGFYAILRAKGFTAQTGSWDYLFLLINPVIYYIFSPYIFEFIAGALLYIYRHRLPEIPLWIGLSAVAITGAMNKFLFNYKLDAGYNIFGRAVILIIPCALLVAWATKNNQKLRPNPLVKVGDASYMLYLIHFPILTIATWANFSILNIQVIIWCYIISISIALLASRYLERPFYNFLCNSFRLRQPTHIQTTLVYQ